MIDLYPDQEAVLDLVLRRGGWVSVAMVAGSLATTRQIAFSVLEALEQMGLVDRAGGLNGRREWWLTPAGLAELRARR